MNGWIGRGLGWRGEVGGEKWGIRGNGEWGIEEYGALVREGVGLVCEEAR